MMTNKRLFNKIYDKVCNDFTDADDLENIGQKLINEAKRRRSSDPLGQVRISIVNFGEKYQKIAKSRGKRWDSEKTQATVESLEEELRCSKVFESILKLPDPMDRWNLGIEMSVKVSYAVLDAQDWGFKLVNGSLGEWCPDSTEDLRKFWENLLKQMKLESVKVTAEMLSKIKDNNAITNDLDRYGYNNALFVLEACEAETAHDNTAVETPADNKNISEVICL
jgi:hypothetical protein